MADIGNKKLIGLLLIAGGGLLLIQEDIKGENVDNGYALG